MKSSGRIVIISIFFFFLCASAILDPLDFLALQSIRKSLSDMPGSSFFSSWDFTSDPCSFSGVFCDSDKVVALNLGDQTAGSPGLTGRLDPAIGKLSALTELSLVPGRVIGRLPETLSQCKNLRFLAVSRNFLSGEIPASFSDLRSLRTLDLSYNLLSGPIPPRMGEIATLSNLILGHNRLSGGVPPLISSSLTRLDLKHNELSGVLSDQSLPSSLQYLSLSSNRLTGSVDRVLDRLDRLNYLDLSMNRFTGSIPGSVFNLPISSLQLQRNLFSGPVRPLDQVTIPTVDLSYNRLSGEISPLLSTVQNLYMNNNKFSGQVPGSFVDRLLAAGIQVLYLQHNYLTGIEINPTAEIPLSSSLCLQYNCMVPPLQTPCPLRAGKQKTRPTAQCSEWRG
ncbi:putative inactive leucine-rich repeat receptor-like protein kinase IMK2 [Cinnamomum micranthum f. kanehirae]|uniref:Putative inactive leucine-rich repeat receptor-like protein kinase IMK2 n=1 Tax=Cinnamomum micranthum f. kanehirae TaxID=337451 RepID=A0A3S3N0T4_9MAGN|nr:putative inactive leucine-rich repeat receptor-like protein kinase IMK2 [Cinnamomum micranthum f. kanehirae]